MKHLIPVSATRWLLAMFIPTLAMAQVNVLTYHNDNNRTGQNLNETILTPANVNRSAFGKLFSYPVDGYIYAQPLYVSGVNIPGQGTHNVIFIATQHNSVYAFDADSNAGASGGLLWHTNLGPSAVTPNNDFGNRYGDYSDITVEVGITSTPVIDLASGTIYVDAFTHDGVGLYHHRLHALNITNGAERPFSPVLVAASVPGQGVDSTNGVVTFNPMQQLQRPALTLAGGMVYTAYSGYADTDPYHGWVIGFKAGTLQQPTNHVFNDTPNTTLDTDQNAGEGGIWMSGNGLAVDASTNLYLITGNGSFNATNGVNSGTEFGDSFLKLSTSNGLAVADYFTPSDQSYLAGADLDLGSGGPLLLPNSVGSVAHPNLMVGCGKEGTIYLLDVNGLGSFDSVSDSGVVQELPGVIQGTWSSPAYFNKRIYILGSGDVNTGPLTAFGISNGMLTASSDFQSPTSYGYPGATPSVSANGTNNAIIWALQTDGYAGPTPATLHAYDAYDLSHELYNSDQAGGRDHPGGAVKFTVPTIANGKVYVGGQQSVSIFGILHPDTTKPTITISSPVANQQCSNAMFNVQGTAKDNVQVSNVWYQLNASGWNLAMTTNAWAAWTTNITLAPGTNILQAYAVDTSGNVSLTNSVQFVYVLTSPVVMQTNGVGTLTPNLNGQVLQIGRSYTVTAKPGTGYVFNGWTGGITNSSLKLTFVMQSNLVLVANFILNPFVPAVTGTYQGLFYDTNNVIPQSSGFFNATVMSSGAFSAKLQSGATSYSLSGQLLGSGAYSNSIPRKNSTPLSVQLQLDLGGGNKITGLVSNAGWTAELLANRNIYSKTSAPPQMGKYTLLIPGNADSSTQPGGDSFSTVSVDGLGNVTLAGTMGDATKLSQKTILSGQAQWPLYAAPYSGTGLVLGWLTFTNELTNDIDGLVTWIKPAQAASKLYPGGFTNQTEAMGSIYRFTNNVPVLNMNTGRVTLVNGNLAANITNQAVLAANNKVTGTNKLSLTITTTSGLFKGSVPDPAIGKTISFSGVLLQKQNFGSGFFSGTNQTGRVFLGPLP